MEAVQFPRGRGRQELLMGGDTDDQSDGDRDISYGNR